VHDTCWLGEGRVWRTRVGDITARSQDFHLGMLCSEAANSKLTAIQLILAALLVHTLGTAFARLKTSSLNLQILPDKRWGKAAMVLIASAYASIVIVLSILCRQPVPQYLYIVATSLGIFVDVLVFAIPTGVIWKPAKATTMAETSMPLTQKAEATTKFAISVA
jgi:hypothetical protein